jgi:hypothetical protein
MIDPDSDTWRAVSAALTASEARLLKVIQRPNVEALDTQFIRGQLAALTEVRALANPATEIALPITEDYL